MRKMSLNRSVAAGTYRPTDVQQLTPQCVVRFDRETFDQIRALALRDSVSFAAKVRELVEWGLESANK